MAVLADWRDRIGAYLARRRLSLHPRKTHIVPTAAPAPFLGFVLMPGGRRRLPEDNIRRFRNRLRGLRDRWRAGRVELDEVTRRVTAWIAHAEHADTWRLRQAILRGGPFDPSRRPDRHPRRVLRGGSGNNKPRNVRAANRNRNATGNRNNNNGFRVASTPQAGAGGFTDPPGARGCVQGRS